MHERYFPKVVFGHPVYYLNTTAARPHSHLEKENFNQYTVVSSL